MKPFIIGIAGYAGHGKTTFAKALQAKLLEHGWPADAVQCVSFAGLLKRSAAAAIGMTERELAEMKNLEHPYAGITVHLPGRTISLTFREYLQLYGDEAHRKIFGEDFWVHALPPMPGIAIIDDVRYPNEVAILDCLMVVHRPGFPVPSTGHESEKWAEHFRGEADYLIWNNGPLEALTDRASAAVSLFLHMTGEIGRNNGEAT